MPFSPAKSRRSSRAATITFVWRGEADAVHLKHWVFGLTSSQPLARVPGTDLWYLTLELPRGSRVEYKLEVVRSGHGEWIQDPLNPQPRARSVRRELGRARHRLRDPELDPRPTRRRAPGRHRRDLRIDSQRVRPAQAFGIYLPARFRRDAALSAARRARRPRLPALRVAEGTILDNLIDRLEIADMIVVLTELARSPARVRRRRAPRALPHRGARPVRSSALSRSTRSRRAAA